MNTTTHRVIQLSNINDRACAEFSTYNRVATKAFLSGNAGAALHFAGKARKCLRIAARSARLLGAL